MLNAQAHLQRFSICQMCVPAHLILGKGIPVFSEA
jgi:hypothetical protein